MLLLGRAIQAIGGNAAWIVGLATVAETVGQENTGRTLGGISSFFTSGLLFGPMISGVLLEFVGYWFTWMFAIAVLAVDMVMRLLMIDKKRSQEPDCMRMTGDHQNDIETTRTRPNTSNGDDVHQHSPLLGGIENSPGQESFGSTPPGSPKLGSESKSVPENFYKFILSQPRSLTALACHGTMTIILLSLDTTLPLYATRTFGWDTAQVSLIFLLLQMPSLVLATFLGILKDRVGTKTPTGLGFLAMALFIYLLGAAANKELTSDILGGKGQMMVALVGIGMARPFISGSAILEITSEF